MPRAKPHHTQREQWATRIGLVFAMAGNAVGLGNFLRFPVQCAQNGGGAFMIPYFVAFLLLGIPLMWIEWGIGRFGGKYGHGTTPGMFHYLWQHPLSKYLGAIGMAIPFGLVVYYTYIESWTLAYSFFSLTGKYAGIQTREGMAQFLTAYQGGTQNEYFSNIGTAYLFFVITLALNFWILSRGLVRGIEQISKVALPLLFVFGLILVVRVFSIGAPDPAYPERTVLSGLAFIWNPDFRTLTDSRVWVAAAGQIFFTLSVGFGAIQTYASYMSKRDDIVTSGLATASTNEFAEVVIGGSIAIPVAVAFFGLQATQDVAQGGAFNLGFFAMPIIFQRMPGAEFFGTIWFLLLFLAGITSSVAMAQPLMAFLQEEFHMRRQTAAVLVGGLAFFLMQPVIFFLPYGFLDEMDFWIGTMGLVVFAIIEVVLFVWVFGSRKAWKEICAGSDIRLPRIFYFVIKYVTPFYLFVLLGFWLIQDGWSVLTMSHVPKENYIYIWFARFLLTGILLLMILLVRIAWQRKHVIAQKVPK
ncbi:MAG: sodium:calcium symporter [Omnitrophica bacterium RIFCSPHIGHO2_02_FULL_49_9]|nr:MAG: sodium:calcium symporter [Omnitrophica bacterium RIFCSPHIGHO2_02_FULL_49_9]OGW89415.1 MAG: sodium:calcium symporter [Omnitrophica bacterium RIFCSPLOWO2_01_FULL_50_24]